MLNDKLLEEALLLSDEIKNTPEYKELISLKDIINNKYGKEVKEFVSARDNLEEIKKISKFHPDYEKASKEFLEKKEALYSIEEVVKYKRLEKEIQAMLDNIVKEIKELLWFKEKE